MEDSGVTRAEFEELQASVDETLVIEKENNRYLRSIRKWNKISFWTKVILWAIVLLAPILLYSFYAPLLKRIPGYNLLQPSGSSFLGMPSAAAFEAIFREGTTSTQ
jgi:hypothetical protein